MHIILRGARHIVVDDDLDVLHICGRDRGGAKAPVSLGLGGGSVMGPPALPDPCLLPPFNLLAVTNSHGIDDLACAPSLAY